MLSPFQCRQGLELTCASPQFDVTSLSTLPRLSASRDCRLARSLIIRQRSMPWPDTGSAHASPRLPLVETFSRAPKPRSLGAVLQPHNRAFPRIFVKHLPGAIPCPHHSPLPILGRCADCHTRRLARFSIPSLEDHSYGFLPSPRIEERNPNVGCAPVQTHPPHAICRAHIGEWSPTADNA